MNVRFKKIIAISIMTIFAFSSSFAAAAPAKGANAVNKNAKKEKTLQSVSNKKALKENDVKKNKNAEKKENKNQSKEIKKEMKQDVKQLKTEMKKMIRNQYSEEELKEIQEKANQIKEKYSDVVIIPIENIITKGMNLKFDTPPVIKYGRTLIPVRAVSQGFGADVDWNEENKIVTIAKDYITIVFELETGKAFVNDEETVIDVPAELMNNRTIVPLRFIAEHLGLKVNYEEDTDTIEIDDEADEDDADDDEEDEADGDDVDDDEEGEADADDEEDEENEVDEEK